MDAIGLNPIKLDAIGLDPIRMNAIRLGVPGASSGSGRPYIDPELLSHVKMAISTWGKTNDDPDRAVLKDLSGNGNDMRLLNFGFAEGSGYGLPGTDFEGWLCTDGVDDIIESVKPISEVLEGSNEITVVSIIHGIGSKNAYTNVLRESDSNYIRNTSTADGKTGIYGYTCKDTTKSIITDILGDKNDYKLEYIQTTTPSTVNSVFSVAGWRENNGSMIVYPVAYAGGFIANKVLTTDEINQIIAYFNLDRPGQIIKPQLYCNIKKQGITNDNHAEFNDQLIDFVGGHNIQLNNIGWKGESGIIDGALYLDGISDFGKATGLPVLKDYTICALRKWLYGDSVTSTETGSIVSKSKVGNDGAFILEQTFNRNPSRSSTFSFGTINSLMSNDKLNEESFTYQTKYSYNGETIVSGSGVDIDSMWLGTIRDGDSRFSKLALWSLMLFPYSLSEFLLERQLRKYKAGTLYPDMIEFRPIVKSNIPYLRILYFITSTGDQIIKGSYIPIGSVIQINIQTVNATDEISSVSVNGKEVDMYNKDETYWRYRFKVTKSPQKINIVISSYLTMLNNDTLIENETLIKNE
ncbi:hypothetical protein ACMSDS_21365 [Bacteroides thetaiotaomicron]|uniref:hypothetical protein n=1 Tax=Bacteroides thetaiotaomicron TaxID=818 RepID=UPI0039C2FAC0